MGRLMSTENRTFWKDTMRLSLKTAVYLAIIGGLAEIMMIGYNEESMERRFPTPNEWSFFSTRSSYRHARYHEDPTKTGWGAPDWVKTGQKWLQTLILLEDPKHDGSGLKEQGDGGILVPGIGKAGYDVTEKSEPWQRGYFETLMGCARSSEHLDGWIYDTTTKIAWPGDVVVGPSNPNRKPTLPGSPSPPREENVRPLPWARPPETYYVKILTTKGFTSGQKLTAAVAYGNWLQDKGLSDSAWEMYKWALDIACSEIPDASSVVDSRTAIIREPAAATSNLVKATTAIATHHAQNRNFTKSLPVYLSILRALRAAPRTSQTPTVSYGTIGWLKNVIQTPPYPPPPPTGDEPLVRSPDDECEEAVLMAYIGEVLFASSQSQREHGLRWTRDAVEAGERVAKDMRLSRQTQDKGVECAQMGLNNLLMMIERIAKDDIAAGETKNLSWLPSWLGGVKKEEDNLETRQQRWIAEMLDLEERRDNWTKEGYKRKVYDYETSSINPIKHLMLGLKNPTLEID